MKKNSFFKILALIMLVIALLTWIIPAGYYQQEFIDQGIIRLGFIDFFQYLVLPFFQSMFVEIIIFLISVGAFYGVLSKTGAYRKMLESTAKALKKKGNLVLIITAFVFAALSSFGGYGLLLFVFIPMVISLILLMGYDRITALLVTFGAMLVGVIGTTFGVSYISQVLSLFGLTYTSQILFKVILFVLSLVILVLFTLFIHKTKTKESSYDDVYLGVSNSKKSPIALYVIFGIIFVLFILGCTSWKDAFGIEAFSKFHTWLTGIQVGEISIFGSLLGSSLAEFGTWNYFQMAVLLIVIAFIIAKIYKVNFFDGITDGIKKIIKPALLVVFAYGVLIIIANTGIFTTLMSYVLGLVKKFNILGLLVSTIINILGSFLHVELSFAASFYLPYLAGSFDASSVPAILNVMAQSIYGLTMFVAPTSLFLILGLSYLEVPYVEWLKKTWKLVLALFLLILIVLVIMFFVL